MKILPDDYIMIHGLLEKVYYPHYEPTLTLVKPITLRIKDIANLKCTPFGRYCVCLKIPTKGHYEDLKITEHEYTQLSNTLFPRYAKTYDEISITPKFINSILSLQDHKPQQNKLVKYSP